VVDSTIHRQCNGPEFAKHSHRGRPCSASHYDHPKHLRTSNPANSYSVGNFFRSAQGGRSLTICSHSCDMNTERQALEILIGLSRLTYTLKLWKAIILDIFNDPGFFSMKPELRPMWRSIVASLMDQDRERFPELLGGSRVFVDEAE
jgi:hypothetical protein